MRCVSFACCLLLAAVLSAPAAAVPIPWKNCGEPTDLLSITQAIASVWPPSVAAPARATATFDRAGNLIDLRLFLVHGIAWTFDSGLLATTTSNGFVSLPASFPMFLSSPKLPITAGPNVTTRIFDVGSPTPVTIVDHANLAADVNAPVTTTVSLSFDGTPGFPLTPVAGSAYAIHVQMAASGGAKVFCMDLTVPLETAAPFVSIEKPSSIPAISRSGVVLSTTMLLVIAFFVMRRSRSN